MSSEQAAPCRQPGAPPESIVAKVSSVIASLADDPTYLANKGLSVEEFNLALPAAIQQLRGSNAASNANRRLFLESFFEEMRGKGLIERFDTPKYGADTVYRIRVKNIGDVAVIQKGCPDGAHSSVRWTRPEWAVEAYLWWVCSSLAYEPGTHIAKGVNRLRKRFFSSSYPDTVDGVIFHNELCGTAERPCPKMTMAITIDGHKVPPPCLYIMPEHGALNGDLNWDGSQHRRFPAVLLAMFGIQDFASYTGYIGFQKRGGSLRNTITMPYGPGRSTTFRS